MKIGWYVHHHGDGHRTRLAASLPHLTGVTALSSLPRPDGIDAEWVELASDLTADPRDPTAHATLHWAPQGHAGLRARMAQISAWIETARPDAMVIDVSVEVALLARLHGVPTVVIAQRGRRDDAPHALAYRQASAVVAPWSEATHRAEDGIPHEMLRFTGAISRLDGSGGGGGAGGGGLAGGGGGLTPVAPGGRVLFVLGSGGHEITSEALGAAIAATSERIWHVAGPVRAAGPNVVDHGERAPVDALLRECSVVVGSAGGNVVAEVAAARKAFVCLPQDRPFDEQRSQAAALAELGVAEVVTRWPEGAAWPALLAAAEARDPARWGTLHDGRGGERLAEVVVEVAGREGEGEGEEP